jgi:hypothetical protein
VNSGREIVDAFMIYLSLEWLGYLIVKEKATPNGMA